MAQYPLDMGRKGGASSNALAVQVNSEGQVNYTALARRGHGSDRIVHASFKDLIPLRQQANAGELSLDKPSVEDVALQTRRTKDALSKLVSGMSAAQKPKTVQGLNRAEATFVRYTPANHQMGDNSAKSDRIMKIVSKQLDPSMSRPLNPYFVRFAARFVLSPG